MPGSIWVLAEQWRGELSEITYEALALGREVADQLSVPLQAVLMGYEVGPLAGSLGVASSVISVDHPALKEPIADLHAAVLTRLVRDRRPAVVMIPLTNVSLGVGTLVGEELGIAVLNFCRDVRVVDGKLLVDCVLYGGKIETTVAPIGESVILGLWPGVRPADKGRTSQSPTVETPAVTLPAQWPVVFKRYIEPEPGDVDITQTDVLVAVGRGIQNKENMELATELAASLGGALCGSRPVIDQGWLPLTRQVGKSGLTVKPKLYLALGISGAPEHVEGMKDSSLIVAVNSDPQAPIFNVAHFGIVADAMDVIPALMGSVQSVKR